MALSDNDRPDPDRLLRALDVAERDAARGKLRIYFGASAGVGKTYAMLQAALGLLGQGADVLVGVAETHARRDTQALLDRLPILPRQAIAYRGHDLNEFDLDGALARKPALILVDELAHTNAPGSRHAKRWQDVQELLAAGIDVWTTVNVQHLDSLNEAVGGITGVPVWETVPDAVFDAADEVILVDLPVDELLSRMKQGKVYVPEQARHATRNFFRKGNLFALRELALRRTADHVDDDMQAYRQDRAIGEVWRTREAVLACVGGDDDAEAIVRSAHRLSQQLECDLHVVTVETLRVSPMPAALHDRLQAVLAMAAGWGARCETLGGGDLVDAVAQYIQRHNITKVALGRRQRRPRGWRWSLSGLLAGAVAPAWSWHRRRLADQLAARCPDIDLIRVAAVAPGTARVAAPPALAAAQPPRQAAWARDDGRAGTVPTAPDADVRATDVRATDVRATGMRAAAGYLWATVYCGLAAGLSALVFPVLHQTNIVMLFLLAVVGVGLRLGRGPAAYAAVVSVALFDFFFVQPIASFAVSDVQYLVTFAVLLGVGILVGQLTAGLRMQAERSVKREADARGLYEFARELSAALVPEQIVGSVTAFVAAGFGSHCTVYILGLDDRLRLAQTDDVPGARPDIAVAQWVCDHGQAAGAGTATLATQTMLYLPLQAPMRTRGVLVVDDPATAGLHHPDARRRIEAYATLVAIALERLHYVEVAQAALISVASEKLRGALLAAVSHDLRTPLTSLIGTAETLLHTRRDLDAPALATVADIRDQARRMHALVANLLDMARLQDRETPIKRDWQSIEELAGTALASMRDAMARHTVHVGDLSAVPLVECDPVLIDRVLCNLLENAGKYAPPGSDVWLDAAVHGREVWVSVADNGPGVPPDARASIFEKFARGDRESATPGVGLGLAVCEAIVTAHRGRIWVDATPGQTTGARFVFSLPLREAPAVQPEAV
ncbi:sensor histidine kinase KdpD [Alcaligenaceae bacterium B3P038]|nr:sensor histidine kinase KdpD [Alcaligenaceae bacterium B3P038]